MHNNGRFAKSTDGVSLEVSGFCMSHWKCRVTAWPCQPEKTADISRRHHWFPARNDVWETTAEMLHYPDLGIDSDWSKREGNLLQPIRSTTQICHQYGISAIVCQMSSRGNPDVEVPKWRLFVQTRVVHVVYLLSLKIFHLQFFAWLRNYLSFYFLFLSSIGNS